jgi:hypothetical protein
VPYDSNISPVDNLYDKPDDLDPQPEFPMRSELTFYKEDSWEPPKLEVLDGDILGEDTTSSQHDTGRQVGVEQSNFPSAILMLLLWFAGMVLWCAVFLRSGSSSGLRRKKGSRKKNSNPKMVKDV